MINKKKLIPGIIVVFSFILALILIGLRPEAGASKRQYIPPLVNTMMVEPTDTVSYTHLTLPTNREV